MDTTTYPFDPSYGYNLEQLLAIRPPKPPRDFQAFWQHRYQQALSLTAQPETQILSEDTDGWRVFAIRYSSLDAFPIRGWLLVPKSGEIKRGFVIGHGYGGRDAPDFHLPFHDAALLFPCFRGLGQSAHPGISADPAFHVLHDIQDRDRYILGGCVADVWLAVSALLELFPQLAGHLGYLGISFGGGIGALALAWEQRLQRGHLNVPTFGHYRLRLRLPSWGSAHSVQRYYQSHKKAALQVIRYFDAALAAAYIQQPLLCACATYDPCVAPPGQFALFNALPTAKQLFILDAGHHPYAEQAEQNTALLHELDAFFAPLRLATPSIAHL